MAKRPASDDEKPARKPAAKKPAAGRKKAPAPRAKAAAEPPARKPKAKAVARKEPEPAPAPTPSPRGRKRAAAAPEAPAARPSAPPAKPPPVSGTSAPPAPPARAAAAAPPPPARAAAAAPPPPAPPAAPPPPPPARPAAPVVAAPAPRAPEPPRSALPPPRPALPADEDGWVAIDDEDGDGGAAAPSAAAPGAPDDEEGWEPLLGTETTPPAARGPRPAIPPLPEEDDFEPIDDEFEDDLPRTPPVGATPRQVFAAIQRGELHAAALDTLSDEQVDALAREVSLEPRPGERRAERLYRLLHHEPPPPEPVSYETEGVLETVPEGFGFLRSPEQGYYVGPFDPYVPVGVIRRFGLSAGHWVSGTARAPRPGERYPTLVHVEEVNHDDPERIASVVPFDRLVVTHPDTRYVLETEPDEVAMRVVDLFCPLGRGQRALVVSPPRAGKTILLQKIADSLARNYPETEIVVLLVDERPEEVTNMRRSVRGEVIASTFDQPPHRHVRVAELAIEKVKRMVELGRHVVMLIDSLTRLGRAYNNETGGGGRLLTGGLEASALTKPKRFFGAARNIEHGGSLTIVATALVDTGSRLDQVIFEEFKGTGNMEIVLSREIANQRIWPAIDVARSGTRREDLLLHPDEQRRVTTLRREMLEQPPEEAMLDVLERMEKHKTNAELLLRVTPS
ncbi:MAG: transcription termination factor Rho [Planctomycetes bacterium]|nr:transcription termination factor Rho [Planctomycetota bacterium]